MEMRHFKLPKVVAKLPEDSFKLTGAEEPPGELKANLKAPYVSGLARMEFLFGIINSTPRLCFTRQVRRIKNTQKPSPSLANSL